MKFTQAIKCKLNRTKTTIKYATVLLLRKTWCDISQNKNLFQNCRLQVLNGQYQPNRFLKSRILYAVFTAILLSYKSTATRSLLKLFLKVG